VAEVRSCDCLVVGAGPAGSAAAIEMAREGLDVVVVDKGEFPRFRIGESFLPRTKRAFRRLGVLDRCLALPHARKIGVEISMGDRRYGARTFFFRDTIGNGEKDAFNMARVHLDAMLVDVARESGAEVRTGCELRKITSHSDDGVVVETAAGTVRAKWMIDASGQATALGREFGTRRYHSFLRNVAYFEHFDDVIRPSGEAQGCFGLTVMDEGWFWLIPLDERRTSVGFVAREGLHRAIDVPANERFWWAVERTPIMAERMANAKGPSENRVIADFTYRCDPFAGPGYFLIGDAAAFLDPVWSTGLTMGLLAAEQVAAGVARMSKGSPPRVERARYQAWGDRVINRAFRLVEGFYDPSFRDLLFAPRRPRELARGFVTLLAGEFDAVQPATAVRTLALASMCGLQRRVGFAPRIRPFRLRPDGVHVRPPVARLARGAAPA
jgi:flavin-dependent dehydrogenase